MMGMHTAPAQLLYAFCLDNHVSDDHLLRRIDQFVDMVDDAHPLLHGHAVRAAALRGGPPQPGPSLVLLLEAAGSLHVLAHRHGRFRQSDILRHLFEAILERCMQEGLVGGEGFAVDASLIAADQ